MKLIISLISLTVFFPVSVYAKNACIQHGDYTSVSYVLVDRTDKLEKPEAISEFLEEVRGALGEGERVVVATSSDSSSNVKILLDLIKPQHSIWESVMKIRAAEKKIEKCFAGIEKKLEKNQQETKYSAILETLYYLSKLVKKHDDQIGKRVFVFSDMVQNSKDLSFWSKSKVDSSWAMKQVNSLSLQARLKDVKVYVSGAGVGVGDAKARSIEGFWQAYFTKANAVLESYGPILSVE